MKNSRKAQKTVKVSVGESVGMLRELQALSQNELAHLTGIPQSTISAIENDRVGLGVERAEMLASALKCHSEVLVFPGWDISPRICCIITGGPSPAVPSNIAPLLTPSSSRP